MSEGYEIYGLRRNPFPHHGSFPVGDPDEELYANLLIGRENLRKELDKRLVSLREGESSAVLLLVGDYGSGKTHALKYLEHAARKRYDKVLPIYIKTLRKASLLVLHRALLSALESSLGREFFTSLAAKALSSKLPRLMKNPDFERALSHVSSGDAVAIRWLRGETISDKERRRMDLVSDVNEGNAVEAITIIVEMLWKVKGMKVLLLVDELEEAIAKSTKEEITSFYSDLRQLIDRLPEGALMVLSATPSVLRDPEKGLAALNPALDSRLWSPWDVVEMNPMEGYEIEKLLRSYLKTFRTTNARGLVEDEYPFTKRSLKAIAEESDGSPRSALRLASVCLAEGLRRRISYIEETLVREIAGDEVEKPLEVKEVEVIVCSKRRKMKKETAVMPILDEVYVKRKILELLRKFGSLTESELKRRIRVPDELYLKTVIALHKEGKVARRRRGRGYRVYLGELS